MLKPNSTTFVTGGCPAVSKAFEIVYRRSNTRGMLLIAVVLKITAAKLTVGAEHRESALGQRGADGIVDIARIRMHDEYGNMGSPEHVGGRSPQRCRLEVEDSPLHNSPVCCI